MTLLEKQREILSILLFGVSSMIAHAQSVPFNYAWWNHALVGEQTGFILGYFDCPSAPKYVYGTSSGDYIAYVNENLKTNQSSPIAVPSLLKIAHLRVHPRPILKGGEEYPDKHGWLDGDWWGDSTHGEPEEKLGYVEGYLTCESGAASISHVNRLVAEINRHFDNEKNERDKIANILQPILDRERY